MKAALQRPDDFWLGQVIKTFSYDFDGQVVEIVKYHPWKTKGSQVLTRQPSEEIAYHCEDLRQSSDSLQHIIIAWFANKNLGLNQWALVDGICRALEVKPSNSAREVP